jgi:hypothetical protein
VLPDVGGRIEQVATVVHSPARSTLRNQELVQGIVEGLAPHVRVLILAAPEMILDPNPLPERITFVEIPDDLDLSIWPQDPFVVLRAADGATSLLASRDYGRAADRRMAGIVAAALGTPVEESSLFFAGGNLVADERHLFVGASLIRENTQDLGLSEAQVVERFASELGRPVLVVGRVPQPTAHIDLLLTPLGGGRVALADPARGAELAEVELERHPAAVRTFEEHAERHFFGHPALRSVTTPDGRTVQAPPVVGGTRRAIGESRQIASAVDQIAADLARQGYEVLRVPFLATREDVEDPGAAGAFHPGFPALSYNNVLVEREGQRERVYLPEYGLLGLDLAARRSWEAAGFEVRTIRGLTTSAMYRGSLRCVVKVLARSG